MSSVTYNYFENNVNQNDFYEFLSQMTDKYIENKENFYLNLIESFLLKYSFYERFNTYCYVYRNFKNSRPHKFNPEQSDIISIVLEKLLTKENHTLCQNSNGNLLYMYLLYSWNKEENNKVLLNLLSIGAHTIEEYKHRFLFIDINNSSSRNLFFSYFMKYFKEYNFNINSILVVSSFFMDSNDLAKDKYYREILDRTSLLKSLHSESSYIYQTAKMIMFQISSNKPFEPIDTTYIKEKKIAILISGQFRSMSDDVIKMCTKLQKEYEADVYLSTWDKQGKAIFRAGELRGFDDNSRTAVRNSLNKHDISDHHFQTLYMPPDNSNFTLENTKSLDFLTDIDIQSTKVADSLETNQHRMFYKIHRAFKLSQKHSEYDVYIRIRPDLVFEANFSINSIINKISKNQIYTRDIVMLEAQGLRIDDNFSIASKEAIEIYANLVNIYPHIQSISNEPTRTITAHRTLAFSFLMNEIEIKNTLNFLRWAYKPQTITVTAKQLLDQAVSLPENKKIPGFHETYTRELEKQLAKT